MSFSSHAEWVLRMIECPACHGPLLFRSGSDGDGILVHEGSDCHEAYPVIYGIPRLVLASQHRVRLITKRRPWFDGSAERRELGRLWAVGEVDPSAVATVAGFDDEWTHFGAAGDRELRETFLEYFDVLPPEAFTAGAVALDAGCGSGRWAYEVASRGVRVIAIDLGLSVETASANTSRSDRVACIQADVECLPLATGSVDWSYSLGVLHHVNRPEAALREIARATRSGGWVLFYLYYALDQRGTAYRLLFAVADRMRRVLSRPPRPIARAAADAIAVVAYLPLARISLLLSHVGFDRVARALPLSWYSRRSFRTMRNDSLDRFGTRLERRYTRQQLQDLLGAAGIGHIVISDRPPFWHGVGRAG